MRSTSERAGDDPADNLVGSDQIEDRPSQIPNESVPIAKVERNGGTAPSCGWTAVVQGLRRSHITLRLCSAGGSPPHGSSSRKERRHLAQRGPPLLH